MASQPTTMPPVSNPTVVPVNQPTIAPQPTQLIQNRPQQDSADPGSQGNPHPPPPGAPSATVGDAGSFAGFSIQTALGISSDREADLEIIRKHELDVYGRLADIPAEIAEQLTFKILARAERESLSALRKQEMDVQPPFPGTAPTSAIVPPQPRNPISQVTITPSTNAQGSPHQQAAAGQQQNLPSSAAAPNISGPAPLPPLHLLMPTMPPTPAPTHAVPSQTPTMEPTPMLIDQTQLSGVARTASQMGFGAPPQKRVRFATTVQPVAHPAPAIHVQQNPLTHLANPLQPTNQDASCNIAPGRVASIATGTIAALPGPSATPQDSASQHVVHPPIQPTVSTPGPIQHPQLASVQPFQHPTMLTNSQQNAPTLTPTPAPTPQPTNHAAMGFWPQIQQQTQHAAPTHLTAGVGGYTGLLAAAPITPATQAAQSTLASALATQAGQSHVPIYASYQGYLPQSLDPSQTQMVQAYNQSAQSAINVIHQPRAEVSDLIKERKPFLFVDLIIVATAGWPQLASVDFKKGLKPAAKKPLNWDDINFASVIWAAMVHLIQIRASAATAAITSNPTALPALTTELLHLADFSKKVGILAHAYSPESIITYLDFVFATIWSPHAHVRRAYSFAFVPPDAIMYLCPRAANRLQPVSTRSSQPTNARSTQKKRKRGANYKGNYGCYKWNDSQCFEQVPKGKRCQYGYYHHCSACAGAHKRPDCPDNTY